MADLFWPGDERAGTLMTQETFLASMVRVEAAWLRALVELRVAEPDASDDLSGLVSGADIAVLATTAEDGGNPVIPLVAMLRARLASRNAAASTWLHRGLTSQDVVDTALALGLRDAAAQILGDQREQLRVLSGLAERHRSTVMAGRTLTQHAVPITFGLKAATWLQGVVDAARGLQDASGLSSQFGGAAGTMASTTQLTAGSPHGALEVAAHASESLGLPTRAPWHTSRAQFTRFGDALVGCTDAWGRIANDVLTLSRPEIGELSESTAEGRGGSSTMPHKTNPVLSVLIRRAALAGPSLGAQLHLAGAGMLDERPDGAWHTEWATLAALARRTAVAASQATELLVGLTVHGDRMRTTAETAASELLAESGSELTDLRSYLGATDLFIDAALESAARFEESG